MIPISLKEEAKGVVNSLLGPHIAAELDKFENPDRYAKQFLEECTYFLGRFIGAEAAKKKFDPLYNKYKIKPEAGRR